MTIADYLFEKTLQIYLNRPAGLPPLGAPAEYGLSDFHERLIAYGNGERLEVWERWRGADKPTYLVFHGINGHWGVALDVQAKPMKPLSFRIDWLKSFPADANLIAVSMPGFGHSSGEPSRPAFDAANAALVDYLFDNKKIAPSSLIAAGESLGANHALNFAATAYERGKPIAQITAIAPFKTMASAAADVIELGGAVSLARRRQLADGLFDRSRHRHDNIKEIKRLEGSGTRLLLTTNGLDEICKPWHQRVLFAAAMEAGLPVAMHPQDAAGHKNWDAQAVAKASELWQGTADEGDAMAAIWQAGMDAAVPPLPESAARAYPIAVRGRGA